MKSNIMDTGRLTVRWTPLDWHRACSFSCCQTGWHSTWLTAGGTRATDSKSSSFLEEKLLTPIACALPESYSFSMALHVAGISGLTKFSGLMLLPFLTRNGQWIFINENCHGQIKYSIKWIKRTINGCISDSKSIAVTILIQIKASLEFKCN